jgi:hypothetical protein
MQQQQRWQSQQEMATTRYGYHIIVLPVGEEDIIHLLVEDHIIRQLGAG